MRRLVFLCLLAMGVCISMEAVDRGQVLQRLKHEQFDVVIIGGGSAGAGVAVDAASRGLAVALVEARDFGFGTSSRSTKLLHGGVRYLEKAVFNLDVAQYRLVKDGLRERHAALSNAPHLCRRLPILTPLYSWWELPYYWFGLKCYDWLAGEHSLGASEFVSRESALRLFPSLNPEGLKGGVLYYDGQFDDARFNLALALTAAQHGAAVANHLRVQAVLKHEGQCCGVEVQDALTGELFEVKGRVLVNATGPLSDHVRLMDYPRAASLVTASAGSHIVLDGSYAPHDVGLLVPHTQDGRVLFMLPWQGKTVVGTTDVLVDVAEEPQPRKDEVQYILHHVQSYLRAPVTEAQVHSAWSGLRPLVRDPRKKQSHDLVRDHLIQRSKSGMITVVGGKWTSYRLMAEEVTNRVCTQLGVEIPCRTQNLQLVGAEGYESELAAAIVRKTQLPDDIAQHLAHAYGGKAWDVLSYRSSDQIRRLDERYPYIEAEVRYAARQELAATVDDVLARRLRLAFLDHDAAEAVRPNVVAILSDEFKWTAERRRQELSHQAERPLSAKAL